LVLALVQAARAAARKKGSYLKALYKRLAFRRGANRAAVALARSLLQIAYHLIAREQCYQDLGDTYFDQIDREQTQRRLVKRLQALGFTVRLQDAERPQAEPIMAVA
jgi:transposase